MASLVLPAQNAAFNLPYSRLIRLAGLTLAEAHLEHPEEPDGCIKGVVPVRKAVVYFFPQAILKRDALGNGYGQDSFQELIKKHPSFALWSIWFSDDVRPDRRHEKWLNALIGRVGD